MSNKWIPRRKHTRRVHPEETIAGNVFPAPAPAKVPGLEDKITSYVSVAMVFSGAEEAKEWVKTHQQIGWSVLKCEEVTNYQTFLEKDELDRLRPGEMVFDIYMVWAKAVEG